VATLTATYVNGANLTASNALSCNGWTVSASDHTIYCSQLMAWYWSQSQPVINTSGQFVGAGINVGGFGIAGGSLNVGNGPINGGNIGLYGAINAPGGFSGGGFTGNGINTGGNCYVGGTYSGGQFQGAGVYCPSYGIRCGSLDTGGGTLNAGNIGLYGNSSINAPGGFTGGVFSGSGVSTYGTCFANNGFTGGVFQGAGVYCPNNGIGGVGFNVYYGGGWAYGTTINGGNYVTIQTSAGPMTVRIIGGIMTS